MTRYFMTIPEAVQLVLQAGAIGAAGEIFVLDMGEPVRIVDLAHNMIRLAGYEPERDIEIVFTGLRPGEKLHEELLGTGERAQPPTPKRIRPRRARRSPLDPDWLEETINGLEDLILAGDEADLSEKVVAMVTAPGAEAAPVAHDD